MAQVCGLGDRSSHIKRRAALVADQIGGGSNAQQGKGQAVVGGVIGAIVVAASNECKKVVHRETQIQHRVDFV